MLYHTREVERNVIQELDEVKQRFGEKKRFKGEFGASVLPNMEEENKIDEGVTASQRMG